VLLRVCPRAAFVENSFLESKEQQIELTEQRRLGLCLVRGADGFLEEL
jgi:hypothetical protein